MSAELVGQLQGMGFSRNKAVRAAHATGTESVEQAVNWIVEHAEDADVDTPLLLPKARAPGGAGSARSPVALIGSPLENADCFGGALHWSPHPFALEVESSNRGRALKP